MKIQDLQDLKMQDLTMNSFNSDDLGRILTSIANTNLSTKEETLWNRSGIDFDKVLNSSAVKNYVKTAALIGKARFYFTILDYFNVLSTENLAEFIDEIDLIQSPNLLQYTKTEEEKFECEKQVILLSMILLQGQSELLTGIDRIVNASAIIQSTAVVESLWRKGLIKAFRENYNLDEKSTKPIAAPL